MATLVEAVDTVVGSESDRSKGDVVTKGRPAAGEATALLARGYSDVGDGGGGLFIWVSRSREGDDGGTVLRPNSVLTADPGRWHRLYSGPLDIRWFGARAGGRPATEAISLAIAASVGVLSDTDDPTPGPPPEPRSSSPPANSTRRSPCRVSESYKD